MMPGTGFRFKGSHHEPNQVQFNLELLSPLPHYYFNCWLFTFAAEYKIIENDHKQCLSRFLVYFFLQFLSEYVRIHLTMVNTIVLVKKIEMWHWPSHMITCFPHCILHYHHMAISRVTFASLTKKKVIACNYTAACYQQAFNLLLENG